MREILFRGKRRDNGQWAESRYPDGVMCSGTITADFDPATVGQYTGLTDRTWRKIFEGDIIKSDRGIAFVVEYVDDISSFVASTRKNTTWTPLNSGTMWRYTVVGNRWDNPELLGEATP